jgi:hypothetical protein
MTEAEWLGCKNAQQMLHALRGRASERKLRLFGVSCCRRIDHLFYSPRYRTAIDVAERFADGNATDAEIEQTHSKCDEGAKYETDTVLFFIQLAALAVTAHQGMVFFENSQDSAASHAAEQGIIHTNDAESAQAERSGGVQAGQATSKALEPVEVDLVRDHFGNPFRPVAVDLSWLTSTVVQLAQGIYDDRAFDRLPILADALQDAGCDHAAVLDHCRDAGPHARGCWVVDMLLGKS